MIFFASREIIIFQSTDKKARFGRKPFRALFCLHRGRTTVFRGEIFLINKKIFLLSIFKRNI